jgi:hypothetical protein
MAKHQKDATAKHDGMQAVATLLGKAIYLAVAVMLLLVALALIVVSLWGAWREFGEARAATFVLLDAVGMTVLGLAIVDVSKYLIEEEVFRERELRSPSEARGALTKFLTIITIVVSLEAVILIFEASKSEREHMLVYPVLLLGAVVAIVAGLGLYQFLSARAQQIMQPLLAGPHPVSDDPAEA